MQRKYEPIHQWSYIDIHVYIYERTYRQKIIIHSTSYKTICQHSEWVNTNIHIWGLDWQYPRAASRNGRRRWVPTLIHQYRTHINHEQNHLQLNIFTHTYDKHEAFTLYEWGSKRWGMLMLKRCCCSWKSNGITIVETPACTCFAIYTKLNAAYTIHR